MLDIEPVEAVIPQEGRDAEVILEQIGHAHLSDLDWRGGKAFSLVYYPDDEEHEHLLEEVGRTFLHENALNPFKYPAVLQMELELIAMACKMVRTAPNACALTSGGAASIFLA